MLDLWCKPSIMYSCYTRKQVSKTTMDVFFALDFKPLRWVLLEIDQILRTQTLKVNEVMFTFKKISLLIINLFKKCFW